MVPVVVTMVVSMMVPMVSAMEACTHGKFPGLNLGCEHAKCDFFVLAHPWAHLLHHWALDLVGMCAHTLDLLRRHVHHFAHFVLHAAWVVLVHALVHYTSW